MHINLGAGAASSNDGAGDVLTSIERLTGSSGDDYLAGNSQENNLVGNAGDDSLYGRQGNDFLNGEQGDDRMFGGMNNDIIWGRWGNDLLIGGSGNDSLYGGVEDDVLMGGVGNDTLYGGGDVDRFVMEDSFGRDRIMDFVDGSEKVDVSSVTAASLGSLHVVLSGGNAVADFGTGDTIEFVGITNAALITEADFIFG